MMKAAGDALQTLVRDPRYVGARIGALAVLHTWTRAMLFHPHLHMLVTGGGLSSDGSSWVNSKNSKFLVPVHALSVIFRAKFCAALKKAGLLQIRARGSLAEKMGRSFPTCRPRRHSPSVSGALHLPHR